MKLPVIPVREFIKDGINVSYLFDNLRSSVVVRFDDGDLVLSSKEIVVNSVVWNIFRTLTLIPITKAMSITNYYTNGLFNEKSLKKLLELIFEETVKYYVWEQRDRSVLNDFLYKEFLDIYNILYNEVIYRSQQYSSGADATDFVNIQLDDKIVDAMLDVKKSGTDESIHNAYGVIKKVLGENDEYIKNPVCVSYRGGSVNTNQLMQVLGPRGFATEITFSIFKDPIPTSFTLGMMDMSSIAKESRTAAKSNYLSYIAIEQSEYLARTLQILAMRLERLVDGDCGSTDYVEYTIHKDSPIGADELALFVGKVYLNEETGKLDIVKATDTHLYDKTLKFRSPVTCKHKNSKCVCMTCFGLLSTGIPYTSNLGHLCVTSISRDITQGMLSNKHYVGTAKGIEIFLNQDESRWFTTKDDSKIAIKSNVLDTKRNRYELIIPQYTAKGILNLNSSNDIENIIPNMVSRLSDGIIVVTKQNGEKEIYPIDVSLSKSALKKSKDKVSKSSKIYGHFTKEFLEYIINNGNYRYRLDANDDSIVIDLNEWKSKDGIIEYISLEYNLLELSKELKSLVRTLDGGDKPVHVFIREMFNLLNIKLNINISLIEILVAMMIVKDRNNGDYHLARAFSGDMAKLPEIIYKGSISGINLFERHDQNLFAINTFCKDLPNHPFDVAFAPDEVVELASKGLIH